MAITLAISNGSVGRRFASALVGINPLARYEVLSHPAGFHYGNGEIRHSNFPMGTTSFTVRETIPGIGYTDYTFDVAGRSTDILDDLNSGVSVPLNITAAGSAPIPRARAGSTLTLATNPNGAWSISNGALAWSAAAVGTGDRPVIVETATTPNGPIQRASRIPPGQGVSAAAPALGPTTATFAAGAAAGALVAAITGLQPGESVASVAPNDGRITISGNNVVVGGSASTAGSIAATVKTSAGRSLSLAITVTGVIAPPAGSVLFTKSFGAMLPATPLTDSTQATSPIIAADGYATGRQFRPGIASGSPIGFLDLTDTPGATIANLQMSTPNLMAFSSTNSGKGVYNKTDTLQYVASSGAGAISSGATHWFAFDLTYNGTTTTRHVFLKCKSPVTSDPIILSIGDSHTDTFDVLASIAANNRLTQRLAAQGEMIGVWTEAPWFRLDNWPEGRNTMVTGSKSAGEFGYGTSMGIGGANTLKISWLIDAAIAFQPDGLFIESGANDTPVGATPAQMRTIADNVVAMAVKFNQACPGVPIAIRANPPFGVGGADQGAPHSLDANSYFAQALPAAISAANAGSFVTIVDAFTNFPKMTHAPYYGRLTIASGNLADGNTCTITSSAQPSGFVLTARTTVSDATKEFAIGASAAATAANLFAWINANRVTIGVNAAPYLTGGTYVTVQSRDEATAMSFAFTGANWSSSISRPTTTAANIGSERLYAKDSNIYGVGQGNDNVHFGTSGQYSGNVIRKAMLPWLQSFIPAASRVPSPSTTTRGASMKNMTAAQKALGTPTSFTGTGVTGQRPSGLPLTIGVNNTGDTYNGTFTAGGPFDLYITLGSGAGNAEGVAWNRIDFNNASLVTIDDSEYASDVQMLMQWAMEEHPALCYARATFGNATGASGISSPLGQATGQVSLYSETAKSSTLHGRLMATSTTQIADKATFQAASGSPTTLGFSGVIYYDPSKGSPGDVLHIQISSLDYRVIGPAGAVKALYTQALAA